MLWRSKEVVWDRFRKTRSQAALSDISFGSNAAANSSCISYVSLSLLGSESAESAKLLESRGIPPDLNRTSVRCDEAESSIFPVGLMPCCFLLFSTSFYCFHFSVCNWKGSLLSTVESLPRQGYDGAEMDSASTFQCDLQKP